MATGWIVTLAAIAMAVAGPRRVFWTLEAWALRNPEAVEPSDAGYAVGRIALSFCAVLSLTVMILATTSQAQQTSASKVDERIEEPSSYWPAPNHTGYPTVGFGSEIVTQPCLALSDALADVLTSAESEIDFRRTYRKVLVEFGADHISYDYSADSKSVEVKNGNEMSDKITVSHRSGRSSTNCRR